MIDPRALILILQPLKRMDSRLFYTKILTLNRPEFFAQHHYIGGIHSVLTMEHGTGHCDYMYKQTLQYFATSITKLSDINKYTDLLQVHVEPCNIAIVANTQDQTYYARLKENGECLYDICEYPEKLPPYIS